MVTDTPTGSITGQYDWEWNQRRSESRVEGANEEAPVRASGTKHSGGTRTDSQTVEALQRENRRLETKVARTERRLACVVDQYERRLAEKNRQLADRSNRSDRSPTHSGPVAILERVRDWISDP